MLKLSYGVIRHCLFVIPPGPKEVTGMKLFYHEAQLYPLNRQDWYVGDGFNVEFGEYQPLIVEPYELKAKGYNTSTTYDHAFFIGLTILRPEEMGRAIPDASMRALERLLGQEFEVET